MNNLEFYNSLTELEKGIVDFYKLREYLFYTGTPKEILEIGSGWGIFTRICMMLSDSCRVTTIDKIPEPNSFEKNTAGFESRIKKITGDSKEVVPTFKENQFDLVFVDGDHGYDGFRADFINAWRVVKNGAYIICDDVLHEKNFEDDYGIIHALSELYKQYNFSFTVYPVAHGIAIIKVIK